MELLILYRSATFSLFLFFAWQLLLTTSASPQISLKEKQQFGLILIDQIVEFQRKIKIVVEPLLKEEKKREIETAGKYKSHQFLKEQYHKILIEIIGEIAAQLGNWTKRQEERGQHIKKKQEKAENLVEYLAANPVIREEDLLEELNGVRVQISKCKSQLKLLNLEAATNGEVPEEYLQNGNPSHSEISVIEHREEGVNQHLVMALSQFRSDALKFMDQLLMEILLLQPVEEFAELGEQIEKQKQEIRQPIDVLVRSVAEEMHIYAVQHTTTGFRKKHLLSGLIPDIVKPIKKPLRTAYKALKGDLLNVIEKSRSQHVLLDALQKQFDNWLNNKDPLLGPVNEEILALAKAESMLSDKMAKNLEEIVNGINKALATIHGKITEKVEAERRQELTEEVHIGEEWIKRYDNLRVFELLCRVSREMHRHLEVIAKNEFGKTEIKENLISLWILANHWMKHNLVKVDLHCMNAVKKHLGMVTDNNLFAFVKMKKVYVSYSDYILSDFGEKILPEQLSLSQIEDQGKLDLKVHIVLTAMHVLLRYHQLDRLHPLPYDLSSFILKNSLSYHPHSSSSLTSSSTSRVHLQRKKNNSNVPVESAVRGKEEMVQKQIETVQKQVEMDVVPIEIGGRLYQLFCVDFA